MPPPAADLGLLAHPAAIHLERGAALRAAGRIEEALAEFRSAAELEPGLPEAHHQLGNALKSLRRYAEAAASLRNAAELAPRSAAIWLNLGVAYLEGRRSADAVECFRRALAIEPERPEAHNILGHAFLTLGRCGEARRSLEEALRLRPGYAAAHDNLGRVLKAEGRADEAVAQHRAALAAQPRHETRSNLMYSLNFPAGMPEREIWEEHRKWGEEIETGSSPFCKKWASGAAADFSQNRLRSETEPLRVGYVSPDFVNHAVAYFIEPVLMFHDRARFEVFCYSDAPVSDAMTRRLQSRAGRWREIAGMSDERAAAIIREDRIDILVDLAGHTARNRLTLFARRAAPVQVTWLGYPNTTGLGAMDYRLTEAVSDPPGRTECWHSETLWRLPETFSCYRPPIESPEVSRREMAAAGEVTFGCFNNFAKVNPRVLALWARILRETPGATLLIKSRGLADPDAAERVLAKFAGEGVDPARIELNGDELSVTEHLRLYHRVDVALDTFPYNGTTTTCEALWMGAPVVTLAGDVHRARVGASLLANLGAPEWIADSPDAYVAIARGLAADRTRLAEIRGGLRERMRKSPLCDGPRFTKNLEEAFRGMWEGRLKEPK